LRAVDWLNQQRFENAQHIDYKEAAPSVLMYVFEGLLVRDAAPAARPDPLAASQSELSGVGLDGGNQPGRNSQSSRGNTTPVGSKLGGLPFHAYVCRACCRMGLSSRPRR